MRGSTCLFGLLGLTALAFACGGNSASPAPSAQEPDAATADDGGAPEGAEPDPHDIYPADHPPIPEMTYHGGRVLKNPKLVTVTFGGMDSELLHYLIDFDDKILTSPWWSTVMDGYGVGAGAGAGHVELEDTFSDKTTSDFELKQYIADQVLAGRLPLPDDDTVYMLYMPAAASIDLDGTPSCNGFGGYHNSGRLDYAAGSADGGSGVDAGINMSQRFVYAVMMECYSAYYSGVSLQDLKDEETEIASHEIAEAATDPDVNAGKSGYYMVGNDAWAPNQRGGENADLCSGRGVQEGTWWVTKVWNFASARKSLSPCVPEPNPVFFGAVPHTEVPARSVGGTSSNDGYIVVRKGETREVQVDVFSTAPLPGELTIVAGKQKGGGKPDPYQLSAVGKGVTMALSQSTALNGDKVTLTISVDNSAASTSSRFVVRAILTKDDYHSWPVILLVP